MIKKISLQNKRNLPRKNLIYYLKVFDVDTSEELGRLVNVHTKGILIINNKKLPLGWPYHLKIMLPKSLAETDKIDFFEVNATPVWSKKSINPNFLEHGLAFTDLTVATTKTISWLIENFQMPGDDK